MAAQASALVLVAAFAAAVIGQGGFFATVQWRVAILIAAAVVLALVARRLPVAGLRDGFVLAGLAFSVWALARATAAGTPAAALTWVLFGAGTAAVFFVCRRLDAGSREMLLAGVLAIGIAVALSGWIGVMSHHRPWALPSAGLWRAASLLTYPNATAALLVPLTLVALSRLTASPGSARLCLLTTGLLCGAGATLSRAGALAFAVGLIVLCLLHGARTVVRAAAGPCAGAAVALLGLVPSLPTSARPQPVMATIGLGAGLGIAALAQRYPRAVVAVLALGGAVGTALVLAHAAPGLRTSVHHVTASRLSLASPARSGETAAALQGIEQHPLAGVGPARAVLRWTGPDGSLRVDKYDHDEYLQVLTDLGIIGAALLAVFLAVVTRVLWRARRNPPDHAVWAGAVAAAAALAVHSGFDFLWHIPAIPLAAAALVGCAVPAITRPEAVWPRPCREG